MDDGNAIVVAVHPDSQGHFEFSGWSGGGRPRRARHRHYEIVFLISR